MTSAEQIQDTAAEVILIGSDNSMRLIRDYNTVVYKFLGDPLIDYCLEFTPDPTRPDEVETAFMERGNVFEVLQSIGYTAVSKLTASAKQLAVYDSQDVQDRSREWDVMDDDAQESLYLSYFFAPEVLDYEQYGPNSESEEEIPIISLESPVVEYEGRKLTWDNTEIFVYNDRFNHHEFSHIRFIDENGSTLALRYTEELIEELEEKGFPKHILPQIENAGFAHFVSQVETADFDDDAEELFGIAPSE